MPACSSYLQIQNINHQMDRDSCGHEAGGETATQACKQRTDHQTTISVLLLEVERDLASLLNPPGEDLDKLSDVAGERAGHGDAVVQHHVGIARQHRVWLGNHWEV